jgi:hypothetical protein
MLFTFNCTKKIHVTTLCSYIQLFADFMLTPEEGCLQIIVIHVNIWQAVVLRLT